MKFKEITPGMVIHCPKEEDARALLEYLYGIGYKWHGDESGKCKDITNWEYHGAEGMYYITEKDMTFTWRNTKVKILDEITEFSDLIELDLVNESENKLVNEMSAEEIIKWLMVKPNAIIAEVLGYESLDEVFRHNSVDSIIEAITAYEATKKAPKPVEVKWVKLCRIIQIQIGSGIKKVVYEVELREDVDAHIQTEETLKDYIAEHNGRYIAVIEDVCRAKEDK